MKLSGLANNTVKKINKIINKWGIPFHKKKWKKILIPNIDSRKQLLDFLNKYVQAYHSHSFVIDKKEKTTNIELIKKENIFDRRMPNFYWDDSVKIGRIKYYYFVNSGSEKQNNIAKNKIIKKVNDEYNKWLKKGVKGVIIDLSKHSGGDMRPCLESLYPILGNNTLFAFSNRKVLKKEDNWVNLNNGSIQFSSPYVLRDIRCKIAVIISNNTLSSGEIIASCFKERPNCKIFGKNSGGMASANDTIELNDDFELYLTTALITTIKGKVLIHEKIEVDKKTNKPVTEAKKWLNNKS